MNLSALGLLDEKSPPIFYRVQFAQDGVWEQAVRYTLSPGQSHLHISPSHLPSMTNPSVEFFFRLGSGRRCFIGARPPHVGPPKTVDQFVRSAIDISTQDRPVTFDEVLEWLRGLSSTVWQPFSGCPDFLELGIADHWKSAGSAKLWRKSFKESWDSQVMTQLQLHLVSNTRNYIALETAFQTPFEHWLGLEVSEEQEQSQGRYQLDRACLDDLVRVILS